MARKGEGLRLPPHSIEYEMSALGAALISRNAAERLLGDLDEEQYYVQAHRLVHRAIRLVHDEGDAVDVLTVPEKLRELGLLEKVGGLPYVLQLADAVPTAAHVDYYAEKITKFWKRRRAIEIACDLIEDAHDDELEPDEMLLRSQERLQAVDGEGEGLRTLDHAELLQPIGEALSGHRAPEAFIQTGFPSLDWYLSELEAGDLVLVAARPSAGKSELCNQVSLSMARRGIPVVDYSLEMGERQVGQRTWATLAGVPVRDVQRGSIHGGIARGMDWLDDACCWPRWVVVDGGLTPGQIAAHLAPMVRKHGIRAVTIDQLQTMESDRRTENEEKKLSGIVYGLKRMAKRLGVVVFLQCQLSRKCEDRTDKRPLLSDLRDSGALEQAADYVLMLYRDSYYREPEDAYRIPEPGEMDEVDVLIRKNRPSGVLGTARLLFERATHRYHDPRMPDEPPQYGHDQGNYGPGYDGYADPGDHHEHYQ